MYQNLEDQEALEVIARLNERTHLEQTDVDGGKRVVVHKGYASKHLFHIEKFVRDIEKRQNGGFIEQVSRKDKAKRIRELYLGKRYYHSLNDWIEQYSELYCYSTRVEVFYGVCKELGLIGPEPFSFGEPDELDCFDGMRYMDVFNVLIERIRTRCQSREFKERERLRLENAEKNKENALAMEGAMFEVKGRWLILSLTLGFKPGFRGRITVETIQRYRERFFAARRFHQLMSGIKNFVWTIEQGEETGLHLHVILFYSADHNHDAFIARLIGEYWVNVVTQGKGDYWNSNDERRKPFYETHGHGMGVGQINWHDADKRKALRTNLAYLAKAGQYLMVKTEERIRTFGMGRVPEKGKAGRPRAEAIANNVGESSVDVEPFGGARVDPTGASSSTERMRQAKENCERVA
ncbi:inovirus Gp2 family protein [Ralstonia solanacearum]|nr:inovirus Gp2 family protein [Ralstonia solanacearum]